MAITQIDPKTALIVVDIQKGIVSLPLVHPAEGVVANIARLTKAFRGKGLPVVLVNVVGGTPGRNDAGSHASGFPEDWADLVPELDQQPSDILVSKKTIGAFHGTHLHDELQKAGVTQVVIAGIATSLGVEGTARAAHEHGYNVTLVTDAMTDLNPAAHDASIANIFPIISETGLTNDVIAKL